jgi:hypothetical protein
MTAGLRRALRALVLVGMCLLSEFFASTPQISAQRTRTGGLWIANNGGLVLFNPKGEPVPRIVLANENARPAPMFTVVIPEDQDRAAQGR